MQSYWACIVYFKIKNTLNNNLAMSYDWRLRR